MTGPHDAQTTIGALLKLQTKSTLHNGTNQHLPRLLNRAGQASQALKLKQPWTALMPDRYRC